jgi:hypothetical protein
MGGTGKQLVFCVFRKERIEAVANAGRIENEDGSEGRSVACGLSEEFTFDVVDDDRVAPAEKLCGRQKALASSCRRNDEEVSKLPARLHGFDAKNVVEVAYTENEARFAFDAFRHELCEFIDPGKAGAVNFVAPREEGVDAVDENQKAESCPLDSS